MDDIKRGFRQGETDTKEAWRDHDGTDVKDAIGNVGDEVRKGLGNAGDDAKNAQHDAEKDVNRNADTDPTYDRNV